MKRLILLKTDGGGVVDLPCPSGKEVRILSILAFNPSLAGGDPLVVEFERGEVIARIVSGQAGPAGTQSASFFLGAALTEPLEQETDVVTGIVTYTPLQHLTAPLPDVWWPFAVLVRVNDISEPATVIYEERPLT